MSAQHTPGPWSIGKAKFDREKGLALQGEVNRLFIPGGIEILIVGLGAEQEEIDTITKLIAAAPDLLEALNSLVADVTAFDYMGEAQVSVSKARAAIAKARGES